MKKKNNKNIPIIAIIALIAIIISVKTVLNRQSQITNFNECLEAAKTGRAALGKSIPLHCYADGKTFQPDSITNFPKNITNFRDCVNAGYPVMESAPRQCNTPDGGHFVEDLKQAPPHQVLIKGEIDCLPKKGSGEQTLECATGLKDPEGRYYGLKNLYKLDPDYKFSANGKQVEVAGYLIQEEQSGPDGNKYDIVGTIDVSSITDLSSAQQSSMTEEEARVIAEQTCIKGGQALSSGQYNPNSRTWWFDANLNAAKQGCNPACVVSEDTGAAEVNWRCTGLLPQ